MKKLINLTVVFILLSAATFAQAQKFGHINFVQLIDAMPEKAESLKTLQKEYTEVQGLIEEMSVEFNKKLVAAQKGYDTLSKTGQQMIEQDLQEKQQRIQQFQSSAEERLVKRREELLNPIIEKAEAAVKLIAEKEGLIYVFDTSKGSQVLYFSAKSIDILPLVKKQLGIVTQ